MTTEAISLRQTKRSQTRRRIGDAALALFLGRGYEHVTFDDIATAAGVSRSTVFRHFLDKEDVVFARDAEHLAMLRDLLRARALSADDVAGLHDIVIAFARRLETDTTVLLRARLVARHPRLQARSVALRARWEDVVARELASGRNPDMRTRVRAATAMGAFFTAMAEWEDRGVSLVPLVRRALSYTRSDVT